MHEERRLARLAQGRKPLSEQDRLRLEEARNKVVESSLLARTLKAKGTIISPELRADRKIASSDVKPEQKDTVISPKLSPDKRRTALDGKLEQRGTITLSELSQDKEIASPDNKPEQEGTTISSKLSADEESVTPESKPEEQNATAPNLPVSTKPLEISSDPATSEPLVTSPTPTTVTTPALPPINFKPRRKNFLTKTDRDADSPPPVRGLRKTPFQKQVLSLVSQVPAGRYTTFSSLASHLSKTSHETRTWVVQGALRKHHSTQRVPCHRVLAHWGAPDPTISKGNNGDWRMMDKVAVLKREMLMREGVEFDGHGRPLELPFNAFE